MAHSGHEPIPTPHTGPGYEVRDANTLGVLIFGILLTVFSAATIVGMLFVYDYFYENRTPASDRPPILQVSVYDDLRAVRAHADETLHHYAWVDRKAGVVRIPIDRALDLVAERGVPKGKGPATEAEVNARNQAPQTADDLKKAAESHKPMESPRGAEPRKDSEPKKDAEKKAAEKSK